MQVKLIDVTMKFNDVVAVYNLNITIESGKLVSLLGPSGCGKSTTLFLLAGLYKPNNGSIIFGDKKVNEIEPENREIGMVFQNYALYPHMSVLKNIMFPLNMQKVPKKEAEKRAKEMADLVRIGHLLARKPGQLSGGQQQRVAIARALVKQPKLLLLDEPLSNLDARLRLEMREEIRRIQQEVGITTIFVTHDQEEAMSISDQVLLLNDGQIQQYNHPQYLYNHPINIFVAKFMGNPPINILETMVDKEAKKLILTSNEQQMMIPNKLNIQTIQDEKIYLGIRPEELFITSLDEGALQGKITYVETIGRDTLIRAAIGDEPLRVIIPPDTKIKIGDLVGFGMKEDRIHIFDSTGRNISQQLT